MRITLSRLPIRVVVTALALTTLIVVPLNSHTTPQAQAAIRKSVTSDYALLRRAPSSYVVGTAYNGWTVDVQQEASGGYRWGRVFGDLNSCLWIYEGAVEGTAGATDSCSSTNRVMDTSEFTNGWIGGSTDDGALVNTKAGPGCNTWDGSHIIGYGNVRPWLVPATPSSPVATSVPLGGQVKWRYVSRDGAWVMVHDPFNGSTDGTGIQTWYFLPIGCF